MTDTEESEVTELDQHDNATRLDFLHDRAKKIAVKMGLPENVFRQIYSAETDWAFLIQTDALIETALKYLISKSLKIELLGKSRGQPDLEKFVESLPVNGRTSLLRLFRALSGDSEMCSFIESLRQIRNGYAHDIRLVDRPLIEVVKAHPSASKIFKSFWPVENSDEREALEALDANPELLRFGVFDYTLRLLALIYLVTANEPTASS